MTKAHKDRMLEGLQRELDFLNGGIAVEEATIYARESVRRWAADQEMHAESTAQLRKEMELHQDRLDVLRDVFDAVSDMECEDT